MQRFFPTLIACAALGTGCTNVETIQETVAPGQAAPKPSVTIAEPVNLSSGLWSVMIHVDIPTHEQNFVTPSGSSETRVAGHMLSAYQHRFAVELQGALNAVLQRNMHCTISALSVMHTREVWIGGAHGGPMTLPSGAIVVLPCGGNEPLVKPATPEAPAQSAPH